MHCELGLDGHQLGWFVADCGARGCCNVIGRGLAEGMVGLIRSSSAAAHASSLSSTGWHLIISCQMATRSMGCLCGRTQACNVCLIIVG